MSIKDCVREAVLKEITDRYRLFPIWVTPNDDEKTLLITLVKTEIVTIKDLREATGEQWRRAGRLCYGMHRRLNAPLGRIDWPDQNYLVALAYALTHGAFSDEEEARIKFDRGDTKDSFIARYNVGTLCQRTVDSWLKKPARQATSQPSSERCPV